MKTPLVSAITINFNQGALTEQLIRSLSGISYPHIEIVVVDNGSENPPDYLLEIFPHIKLIKTGENLGFAGGNNVGILHAQGHYLLFLNNDTEVAENFLEPLVRLFEETPDAGIASPKILYWNNGKKDIIQYAGSTGLNPYTGRGFTIGHGETDHGRYDYTEETRLVHGAAMMVPAKIVENVGLMPDLYFLYYEEHDWCEMIKRAGYRVFYVGYAAVYHKESMSVGKDSPLRVYYLNRGRLIFSRRNTKGIKRMIAVLFYSLVSLPVTSLKYLGKGRIRLFWALWKAYFWNLRNRQTIKKNPRLQINQNGERMITQTSCTINPVFHKK